MHGEIKKVVVTSVVKRHYCIVPGMPRASENFCDPTAVSRLENRFESPPLSGGDRAGRRVEVDMAGFILQIVRRCKTLPHLTSPYKGEGYKRESTSPEFPLWKCIPWKGEESIA